MTWADRRSVELIARDLHPRVQTQDDEALRVAIEVMVIPLAVKVIVDEFLGYFVAAELHSARVGCSAHRNLLPKRAVKSDLGKLAAVAACGFQRSEPHVVRAGARRRRRADRRVWR